MHLRKLKRRNKIMIETQMIFNVIRNKQAANPLAVFERYINKAEDMHPWGRFVYWNKERTKFIVNILDFQDAVRIQTNEWFDFPLGVTPFIQLKNWKQRGVIPTVFPFTEAKK